MTIAEYRNQMLDKHAEVLRLYGEVVEGLSEKQLQWRPAEKRWSIREILEHLALAYTNYTKAFPKAFKKMKEADDSNEFNHSVVGKLFVKALDPGKNMKLKAPGAFKPQEALNAKKVRSDFLAQREELKNYINDSVRFDLASAKFGLPVFPLARISVGDFFRIQLDHDIRHLHQARRVKEAGDFPAE